MTSTTKASEASGRVSEGSSDEEMQIVMPRSRRPRVVVQDESPVDPEFEKARAKKLLEEQNQQKAGIQPWDVRSRNAVQDDAGGLAILPYGRTDVTRRPRFGDGKLDLSALTKRELITFLQNDPYDNYTPVKARTLKNDYRWIMTFNDEDYLLEPSHYVLMRDSRENTRTSFEIKVKGCFKCHSTDRWPNCQPFIFIKLY